MRWFKRIKKAAHGDTLDGQVWQGELAVVRKKIRSLLKGAMAGGPSSVMPRWRGEIRRAILLLPAEERLDGMSMIELGEVRNDIGKIEDDMARYSSERMREIMGDG
jgi:hypothetical protein